jgi:hypothetical protein
MSRSATSFWLLIVYTVMIVLAGTSPAGSSAAQYYFSLSGNDQSGSGTLASPWRSISKFNTLDLNAGDSVFFHAGDVFPGSMELDSDDTGTNANGELVAPITLTSYGGGPLDRAVIRSAANKEGLLAYNNGGIELRNLEFVNGGSYQSNSASGIQFKSDYGTSSGVDHLNYIHLDNVVSHGFHQSGLSFDALDSVGYQDVQVTNSQFYDNQFAGLQISASEYTELVHRDVRVDNVVVHDNSGFVGCTPHCGHGIVVGQVDGAVIQNSTAYSNGVVAGKGNVGIWTWQSNNITIQHNTAYGNRSPSGADGGGFDIDGGVTNSIVQYNTSHDNAGAGYLLAEFAYAEPMLQNVVRYNLSVNDGNDDYGAFTVSGSGPVFTASSAVLHNNTVVVDRDVAPASRGAVWFADGYHSDVNFINNVLVALNGAALVDGTTTSDKDKFINNAYWTAGAPVKMGGVTYASIAAWAAAAQQETLDGVYVGTQSDPNFGADGLYRPMPPSQLIDGGLSAGSTAWPAWLMGVGPTDLYGVSLPQGAGLEIGASEYVPLTGDFNLDGRVDGSDYILWRKSLGQTGSALAADGNHDGVIDFSDYALWRANFGGPTADGASFAAPASTSSIPEPPAFLLALMAYFVGCLMKR